MAVKLCSPLTQEGWQFFGIIPYLKLFNSFIDFSQGSRNKLQLGRFNNPFNIITNLVLESNGLVVLVVQSKSLYTHRLVLSSSVRF